MATSSTSKKSKNAKKPASSRAKTTKKPATKKTSVKAAAKPSKKVSATSVKTAKKPVGKDVAIEAPTITKTAKKEPRKRFWQLSQEDKMKRLRVWNYVLAGLHAAQGIAVLLLSQDRTFPVSTNYLTLDALRGSTEAPVLTPATRNLFDVNVAWVVAAFFFMSAIAHISIATWYRKRYERDLANKLNRARWIEYSLSASTMIVAIAMIAGIYDLSTLLMMFALTAVMNLCGLVMELVNRGREKIDWSSYIVGCIAGIVPWIVYSFYIVGSSQYGEGGGPPTFVYFILASIFLFFNCFALVMLKQYRGKGRWADYLVGERAYMVLSLVAKAALAWQVFGGTLRP